MTEADEIPRESGSYADRDRDGVSSADLLVYVESVDANSVIGETPLDHMRSAETIIAERGHSAESFVRTAAGRVITPPEFSDGAFDCAVRSRRAVAARRVEASQWGMPVGADYVAGHWFTASASDPENFSRLEMPAWRYIYASADPDRWGTQAIPVGMFGDVWDVRLTPDGGTAVTLHWSRDPLESVHSLFAHDLKSGQQRLITRLTDGLTAPQGDLSVSPDGCYVIAGFPMPWLIDLRTGHSAGFGADLRAATWYPRAGASCVLGVTGAHDAPPWRLVLLDLATFRTEHFADLPRRVDGIQVAADGSIAARMRPQGETGWFDELVVSTDDGRNFEPLAPLRGRCGWRRRSTRPRWIDANPPDASPVVLYGDFEEFLRAVPPDNGASPGEAGWMLDLVKKLIAHRLSRLRERPSAADLLLAQLHILAALPILLDPETADAVIGQVVPAARAAAITGDGERWADAIDAVSGGRVAPPFTFRFGGA